MQQPECACKPVSGPWVRPSPAACPQTVAPLEPRQALERDIGLDLAEPGLELLGAEARGVSPGADRQGTAKGVEKRLPLRAKQGAVALETAEGVFGKLYVRSHSCSSTVALVAPVEIPPSTSSVCPVTYSLASEARKITAPSRSRGLPGLFSGMRSSRYSTHARFS